MIRMSSQAMSPSARSILKAVLLAAGLVACGVAVRLLAPGFVAGGTFGLDAARHGAAGLATFLLLGTIACAVGLPRQIVCFAAGLAWGALAGTGLALVATVLGCALAFVWARAVARDWARRVLLGRFRRLAALDRAVGARPFATVLTLRLLPVGSSLAVSLASGLSRAPFGAFFAATALGALPQTLVFALLGSGVGINHVARIAVAVALFVASAIGGGALMRRRDTALETAGAD